MVELLQSLIQNIIFAKVQKGFIFFFELIMGEWSQGKNTQSCVMFYVSGKFM